MNYPLTRITKLNGQKKLLIIGLVWPEPTSSAAGTRMVQLIDAFLSDGYEVLFASAASKSEFSFDLKSLGVSEYNIQLNNSSFNSFIKGINPSMVLFDRFMIEEQYGWRIQQECPDAIRLLDTEGLHCLRSARQNAIKTGNPVQSTDLFSETARREIASIYRCDLSLIISEIEMSILQEQFHVDPSLIYYLPFLEKKVTEQDIQHWKSFEQREGFIFIGNFLHEPNWRTLQILKTKIWPGIRKELPDAILHIYGAYAAQKVMQLANEKENFYIHGRAKNAYEAIANHRVLLAPIPFGAGVKGKFIDAMRVGTPCVTTSVGAEGMNGDFDWNGAIEDDPELFTKRAVQLHQDQNLWQQAQQNGISIIHQRYEKFLFIPSFIHTINALYMNLAAHRQHNFFGQILQHHTANSAKYMSLWIEEKNSKK